MGFSTQEGTDLEGVVLASKDLVLTKAFMPMPCPCLLNSRGEHEWSGLRWS